MTATLPAWTAAAPAPAGGYPPAVTHRRYGRRVWELGEDGDDGLVIEGHDRRAWAVLAAELRAADGRDREGLPRLLDRIDAGTAPAEVVAWMTWVERCGCTPDQHAGHQADRWRDGGPSCWDGERELCSLLAPCQTEEDRRLAWWASWHHDPAALPAGAVPILRWLR